MIPSDLLFYKYHGTGNDFILIEDGDASWEFRLSRQHIAALCARHTGIGADGLMLLQRTGGYDFRMVYYNADGGESSFCGNGSRCLVAFAYALGWIGDSAWFVASDGDHEAKVLPDGRVSVHMKSISEMTAHEKGLILDSGSPHFIREVACVDREDLIGEAHEIRYSEEFRDEGINVNLVEMSPTGISMRTYERGVEGETLSCGTGVTAAAIAWAARFSANGPGHVEVNTRGGQLEVQWEKGTYGFRDIWLTGPARQVYTGRFKLDQIL